MTIISHSHKFIYIKARKVASSSVLVALGQHCTGSDIVTAPGDAEGFPTNSMNDAGIRIHSGPDEIKQLVTQSQWDTYQKITCIRNPWDIVISFLFWRFLRAGRRRHQHIIVSDRLRETIANKVIPLDDPEYRGHITEGLKLLERNDTYHFAPDGSPYADIHLRYETLQDDFTTLCNQLGVAPSILPTLKSFSRPPGIDYRDFFDDELCAAVADKAALTIKHFGYEF